MAPAKTPPTRTEQRRSAGSTDDDNPSPAPPHHAKSLRRAGTNTARPTMRRATHQHSTPNLEGGTTRTQQGQTMSRATRHHSTPRHGGGADTDTSRPTMGGGHAPTQHAPPWRWSRTSTIGPTMKGGPCTNTIPTVARQTTQSQPQLNRRTTRTTRKTTTQRNQLRTHGPSDGEPNSEHGVYTAADDNGQRNMTCRTKADPSTTSEH